MAVKNVGERGTVSHRDASRDGGGRSSAHPQPNPDIFYCLLGGVFLLLATATAKPRKPSPPTAKISLIPCAIRLCQYIPVYVSGLPSNIHLGFGSSSFFVFLHLFSVFLFFSSWLSVFIFPSSSFSLCLCLLSSIHFIPKNAKR